MTNQPIKSNLTENLGDSNNSLTFGNFQTQICGAMSMGLLNSQSEIAQTGVAIANEFTSEQKDSYKSQSAFLLGSYDAALTAASKQAAATRWGAYGEFSSAGFGLIGMTSMVREGSRSETALKLKNSQDKLAQQNKLLDLAHKNPPTVTSAAVGGTPVSIPAPRTYKEAVIQQRAKELSTEGASRPRLLKDAKDKDYNDQKWVTQDPTRQTEDVMFKQKAYNRKKGQYYNDKATDDEVSRGTATRGAYHLEGLDEEAIKGMTPEQHTKSIAELRKSIESTKLEINSLSSDLQRHTQMIGEGLQIAKSCTNGMAQLAQATPQAESKKADAQSQLASNSGSIAGGIAQNANSAKEGGLSTAQNAMQSFGRVYDGMRG